MAVVLRLWWLGVCSVVVGVVQPARSASEGRTGCTQRHYIKIDACVPALHSKNAASGKLCAV
jgi:hypothetical protein